MWFKDKYTVEQLRFVILDRLIRYYGILEVIISNRDKLFTLNYLDLPSGRVSVPIFRPDPDRMPGRVSVPRLGTDPPVPTLKIDPIRQEPEF